MRRPFPWGRVVPVARAPLRSADVVGAFFEALSSRRVHLAERLRQALGEAMEWDGTLVLGTSARALISRCLAGLARQTGTRRVIVPAFGCRAVRQAVAEADCEPVACDLDAATGGIDPSALARALREPAAAVVLVPLFGVAGTLTACSEIAQRAGVPTVVDGAQAFCPQLPPLVPHARAHVFSFAPGKHVPLFSGGMALYPGGADEPFADQADGRTDPGPPAEMDATSVSSAAGALAAAMQALLYALLWRPRAHRALVAMVARRARDEGPGTRHLWAFSAALGLRLLPLLKADRDRRHENERLYRRLLAGWTEGTTRPGSSRGAAHRSVQLACGESPALPLLRFPILLPEGTARERLIVRLWQQGFWVSETNYGLDGDQEAFPGAWDYRRRLLTLPVHAGMGSEDIHRLVDLLCSEVMR
ncbi:MAG: DegT/DnrJ/EryC1/StrS family aminotransferase [Candidatus Eisenbacteria sp.]|nr:DegT/DnrJ/EryC1/StrS family aminotransferase [Candidatus Eisenbacteria bacterium]